MNRKKIGKILGILTIIVVGIFVTLLLVGAVKVSANGLVDDTVDASKEYSKYSIFNYGLDFYVSNSWTDIFTSGVGGTVWKQVSYVIYSLTNFLWTLSLLISSATGYLIKEAYSLDFVSTMSDSIGEAIQAIAGVTKSGFSTTGFYVGFILLIILIVGAYVAYTGLIKRETTKAIKAVINMVVVFILSASFIAYAPDYIKKINQFSSDVSTASLTVGSKVIMPNASTNDKDSVNLIRESLFNIQVVQPWLILQYGDSTIKNVGETRVADLLSVSPSLNRGEDRENVVKKEVEEKNNENMTTTKVIQRLGITVFIVIFDICISIFVFLLTGTMIFSQVLFIIYAMILPISFLLSMIPTCEGMSKKAIMKLFNVIMTRAGITLIVTITFSISTMIYKLSADYPFFFVAFLQIVTFVGIYSKQGDLLSMFSLQSNDSQSLGRRVMNKPTRMARRGMRNIGRAFTMSKLMKRDNSQRGSGSSGTSQSSSDSSGMSQNNKRTSNKSNAKKQSLSKRMGQSVGNAMDVKNKVADKAGEVKDKVQSVPTNARYAAFKKKEDIERGTQEFVTTIPEVQKQNQEMRSANRDRRRQSVASKRAEMDRARNNSDSTTGTGQGSGSSNNTTGSGRGNNGSNGTSRNGSGNSTTGTGRGSSGGSRSSGSGRENSGSNASRSSGSRRENSNTSGNAQSNRSTSENEKSNYHSSDNSSSTSQDRDHYKKSDTTFSDKKTSDKKTEKNKNERRSADSRPSTDWRNNSYRSKKKDADEKGRDNK